MSESEKAHTNGEITVIWKPGVGLPSSKCVRALGEVFNVSAYPWINMGGTHSRGSIERVERSVGSEKVFRAAR